MIVLFLILITAFILYYRYFPVPGVPLIKSNNFDLEKIKVLDLRDYHESYKNPLDGSINIPIAYLNRNISDIPKDDIYVVASSPLEKNVGIRILRQKGFRVVGYSISDNNKLLVNENSLDVEKNCC